MANLKLKNPVAWKEWEESNTDPYGKACVDVARRVMEMLDTATDYDPRDLVSKADKEIDAGGITGFMAGAVAQMVSQCHERGEEFRRKWNRETQFSDEGDRANDTGGVLNPALLEIRG